MSGSRYIKQAIIAALCEHPDQDKYKQRALSGENLDKIMEALSQGQTTLTKADFLSPDDSGKFIIDTPGFWKNFDKVIAIIGKAGEKFTVEDFSLPLQGYDRDLLESAEQYGGLGKIFTFEVWQGRFDDMERLWYRVPAPTRRKLAGGHDGLVDRDLKRRILVAEGKSMPEDGLRRSGLSPDDIFNAFSERGNYEDLKRRLTHGGDYLRKDYLLLPDSSGDTVFYYESAWEQYEDIAGQLIAHGERLEIADFIREVGYAQSILARAGERKALHHVFKPEHWEGRLAEMLELWSFVKDGWKAGSLMPRDFDNAYAAAESLTYGKLIDFDNISGKQDLLQPIADKVLPLGLKGFWDNAATVSQKLADKGEKITLSDLRLPSGPMGNSCLMTAVKFGHFSSVANMARQSGESLTLDDFFATDRHGQSLLNILADRRQLSDVFAPELWAGRVAEMKVLWSHVRLADRNQIDINEAEVAAKQATLKQGAKNRFKL